MLLFLNPTGIRIKPHPPPQAKRYENIRLLKTSFYNLNKIVYVSQFEKINFISEKMKSTVLSITGKYWEIIGKQLLNIPISQYPNNGKYQISNTMEI